MAYYDALIAKWPDMSGDTTAAKLSALNAERVAGPVQGVTVVQVMTYLWTNGLWLPMLAAANAGTSNGAIAAVALLEDRTRETIDFSLPTATALLADLVSKSLLTQAQSDAIVAMGTQQVPWWQANGYPEPISYGDLAMASLESLTPWAYSVASVTGPDALGNTTVALDIWDTVAPDTKHRLSTKSQTMDAAAVESYATRQMRLFANRAALAATIEVGA